MKRPLLDSTIEAIQSNLDALPPPHRKNAKKTLGRLKAVKANVCASPDLCGSICNICRDDDFDRQL